MKKYLFMALVALTVVSCSKEMDVFDSSMGESKDAETVTLSFSPFSITTEPFSTTRGAGDAVTLSDVCNRLDIFIKDDVGSITTINQSSSDTGFGTATVTLNSTKEYTIYAVAHTNSSAATLSEDVISFPDDNISEIFYYTDTFTPNTSTKVCTLDRKVAKFSIWMTDAIPEEVTKITIQASNSGTKLNTDGSAANLATRTKTFTSWTSAASGTLFSMLLLPTSMTAETTMTFTVTAYNSSDEEVETRTFTDVPIRRDYKTMYKGAFFTSNALSISFSGTDWYSYDTVNF